VHAKLELVVSRAGRGTHQGGTRCSSEDGHASKGGRLKGCGMGPTGAVRIMGGGSEVVLSVDGLAGSGGCER
jgi:hypothetical protein